VIRSCLRPTFQGVLRLRAGSQQSLCPGRSSHSELAGLAVATHCSPSEVQKGKTSVGRGAGARWHSLLSCVSAKNIQLPKVGNTALKFSWVLGMSKIFSLLRIL
jgi:hypothetical protein